MRRILALTAALAALVGAGVGAGTAVLLSDDDTAEPGRGAAPAPTHPASTGGGDASVAAVAAAALPGVVSVEAEVEGRSPHRFGPRPEGGVAGGSGFMVDDEGRILTNAHVVSGATSVRVIMNDGASADAEVLGVDDSSDLALLRIDVDDERLRPLELAEPGSVEVGERVVAIGSPFGYEGTVTTGVVSAMDRSIDAPNGYTITRAVQTDAAINHGNSGGPLLDLEGRVVGVNAQIADSGVDANVGVGFAISSGTTAEVLARLSEGGEVSYGWLGVAGDEVDAALREAEGVGADHGMLVTGVVPGGPAAEAGLAAGDRTVTLAGGRRCVGGDVITGVDGTEVRAAADVQDAVARAGAGTEMRLDLASAGGETRTVTVTLSERPDSPPDPETGCD